jgi:hypothetical protein
MLSLLGTETEPAEIDHVEPAVDLPLEGGKHAVII